MIKIQGYLAFHIFVDKFDPTPMPMAMRKAALLMYSCPANHCCLRELFERLVEQNKVELVGTNSPSWLGVRY